MVIKKKKPCHKEILPEWKMSRTIPIPKGGNAKSIFNYRPIALTSTSCNVFELSLYEYKFFGSK